MKKGKTILGVINAILLAVYFAFSLSRRKDINTYSTQPKDVMALIILFYVFFAIAIIAIVASIIFDVLKDKNEKIPFYGKIASITAPIAALAAGGVGLPLAITSYNFNPMWVANIAMSGTIILFSIIYGVVVAMSFMKKPESDVEFVNDGSVTLELDSSKEVEKTAQISAVSNVGVGLWTNICYSLCQIFGKKSATYQMKMNRIKNDALNQLLGQAKAMNADTVTDVHYALSGLTVVASGTAVFYKK